VSSTLSSATATVTKVVSDAAAAVTGDSEPVPAPDETPISPSDASSTLAKALKGRPEKQDLVDRNILKDTNVAPALHAQQAALERSRLENSLEHKLEARPRPSELVREGILKADEAPPS